MHSSAATVQEFHSTQKETHAQKVRSDVIPLSVGELELAR